MSKPDFDEGKLPPAAVLAVDDHRPNLLVLEALLEPLRTELVTVASGREALAEAERREFAVVLLDIMMPEMDGFETLRRLRVLPLAADVPVILITAHDLEQDVTDKLEGTGLVDYIRKPIPAPLLRSKVGALVSLYRRGEALTAKDRGIAMLAHDLQNPLSAIRASTEILLRADLPGTLRPATERIGRAATRMSEMVKSLTDYARAGRGTIPIAREACDLGALCQEVVDDCQHIDSARSIQFRCAGLLVGWWDRTRLYQAISNLVTNAFRHGSGEIFIEAREADGTAEILVRNGGAPIPEALLPTIFEPFKRGESHGQGLGLGLYVVREIARAHQGTVQVRSSADRGTVFGLRLPLGTDRPHDN